MPDETNILRAEQEAVDWSKRLSGFADVSEDTLIEFHQWRKLSINRYAYETYAHQERLVWVDERLYRLSAKIDVIGETVIFAFGLLVACSVFLALWIFLANPHDAFAGSLCAAMAMWVGYSTVAYLKRKLRGNET